MPPRRVSWAHVVRRMRNLCLQATLYRQAHHLSIQCAAPTHRQLTAMVEMPSWGIRKNTTVMSQISTCMMISMVQATLLPIQGNTRSPPHNKNHSIPVPAQKPGRFLFKRGTMHHGHILSRRWVVWPSPAPKWKDKSMCWSRFLTKSFLLLVKTGGCKIILLFKKSLKPLQMVSSCTC